MGDEKKTKDHFIDNVRWGYHANRIFGILEQLDTSRFWIPCGTGRVRESGHRSSDHVVLCCWSH